MVDVDVSQHQHNQAPVRYSMSAACVGADAARELEWSVDKAAA
jgi:hypothetical protein